VWIAHWFFHGIRAVRYASPCSRALVLNACAAAMYRETADRMEESSPLPASEGLFLRPASARLWEIRADAPKESSL
jgi:hypothetical protein